MREQRFSRRPVLHLVLILFDPVLALAGCFAVWPRLLRTAAASWRRSLIVTPAEVPAWRDLRAVEPKLSEWAP